MSALWKPAPSAGKLDRRTAVLGAAAVLVAGAIVFAPAIAHGGFYADDWENGSSAAYDYEPYRIAWRNPILGWLLPLPHIVFGVRPAWHLALALALGVGASLTFAALLVRLRIRQFDAVAIALLALLFPLADSMRLWATAGLNAVALMLAFAGAAGGIDRLHGRTGFLARRYRWLLGASVLAYNGVAPLCLLTGPVYRLAGVGWPRAKTAWRGDAWWTVPLVVYVTVVGSKQHQGPVGAITHGWRIARDGVTVIGWSLLPVNGIPHWIVAVVASGVGAGVGLALWRRHRMGVALGPSAAVIARWLLIAAIAVIAVAACWTPYVSAEYYYHPLAPGILNRVNFMAAFPIAVLVYALAAAIVAPWRHLHPVLLAAAVAVGWAVWDRRDSDHFVAAARAQDRVLAQLRALPPTRQRQSVFVGGYPLTSAPQVPVFYLSWDLNGAVRLTLDNGRDVGEPLRSGVTLVCGRTAAVPNDTLVSRLAPQPYANLVLVNVARHSWLRIGDQRECLAGAGRLGFRASAGVPVARDKQGRPAAHVVP